MCCPFCTDLDQEGEHAESQVGVSVVEVLDHTLGPLETLFAEGAPAVERHDGAEVLQLFALLGANLHKQTQENSSSRRPQFNSREEDKEKPRERKSK
jgi:hypothetical protein